MNRSAHGPGRIRSQRPIHLLILASLALTAAGTRLRADVIGTIANASGSTQLQHAGEWTPATSGAEIAPGDRLKTAANSRLTIALLPESSLSLEADSEVIVERHGVGALGQRDTLITLVSGSVRGTASAAYEQEGASFVVASPTARIQVLGGEFAIEYSGRSGTTDVFGVRGRLNVHSTLDPTGAAVLVTANQAARVKQGAQPEPAYRTDWILFDRPPGSTLEYSTSRLFESAIWLSNPVLSGSARVPLESMRLPIPGSGLPPGGSTVDSGNDTGSVLGQPPAALTGPGRLRVTVR